MISLIIKKVELTYNLETNTILADGKPTSEWVPVFIPNKDSDPDFFGFLNKKENKVYDIYKHTSVIVKDSDITI